MDDPVINSLKHTSVVLKSMAHPVRLAVLKCINESEYPMVKHIYESLNLKQSEASHHLGILRMSGVLVRLNEKGKILYEINPEDKFVQDLIKILLKHVKQTD